nr:hypothetical protein [uncultured Desulfobulbus sp.]
MIGLMYLMFFIAYLLVSLAVVASVVIWAKRRGRNSIVWGIGAVLIMYNLVFWDWIPSIIQHEYYCRTQAGFWIYKTLDQWKEENPGVYETLARNDFRDKKNYQNVITGGRGGELMKVLLN